MHSVCRREVGTGEAGPCADLVLRGFKKGWEMISFEERSLTVYVEMTYRAPGICGGFGE